MMTDARAIATKVLYLFMAVIIATGGFFAAPPGPAQAASPFNMLNNPANLPTGEGTGVAFSDNATYMAVANTTSGQHPPFVTLYKRSGATFTKLAFAGTGLTSDCAGVAFSPGANYLAVTSMNSPPYLSIYKRTVNTDTFVRFTDPATLPPNKCFGVTFSPDGNFLAMGGQYEVTTSPTPLYIYKWDGDSYEKLSDPSTMPGCNVSNVAFSHDSTYLAVPCEVSPYLLIYKWNGSAFLKLPGPSFMPPSASYPEGVAFSHDDSYLAVSGVGNTPPNVYIYTKSGDNFAILAGQPATPPHDGMSVAFSHDSGYMALSGGTAYYGTMDIYSRSGSTFTRLDDPSITPSSYSYHCAFGYDPAIDATFLAYTQQRSPYVLIYSTPIAPSVSTNAATSGAGTTATLNGTLDDWGSASSAATLSFEYGLTAPAYGSTAAGAPSSSSTSGQTFTGAISGLAANTTYHFRAKAATTSGTAYGSDRTFTTGALVIPTVTTSAATIVTGTGATLNMSYNMGEYTPVNVRFAYKKHVDSTWTNTSWVSKSASGTYSLPITGLASAIQYDFMAGLQYDGSTEIQGSTLQFTTAVTAPTVITDNATDVTPYTATLNMIYNSGSYDPVLVRVNYKKNSDGSWPDTTAWTSKSSSGTYSENVTGLLSNSIVYNCRAELKYSSSPEITILGNTVNFTTLKIAPTVTTDNATHVWNDDEAILNMHWNMGNYTPVYVRFAYKISDNTTWTYTDWVSKTSNNSSDLPLTGLNSNTQYDFRGELKYSSPEIELQGSTLNFTTGKTAPTLTPTATTGVTGSGATLNMSYTMGDYDRVEVQFWYKAPADASWTICEWYLKSEPGTHSQSVTGLLPNTTYSIINQLRYGEPNAEGDRPTIQVSGDPFTTTGPVAPTVTTNAATVVINNGATLNMSYTIGDNITVDVRFGYKKSIDPGWIYTDWVSKSASGTYAKPVSGLVSNTLYNFRSELQYDGSTEIQGSTLNFTTGKTTPTVTTSAATGITNDGATLNMSYTIGDYNPVDVRFAYKKHADSTWDNTTWVSESALGTYAKSISGLDTNIQYDFRAELKYDGATEIQGSTLNFTPGRTAPTVTTDNATAITTSGATLNMIYTIGDYNPVDVRFAYKKSVDPGWTNTDWISESALGAYAKTISGLDTNTPYEFRAELKYDGSTEIKGSTLQFTTSSETNPTITQFTPVSGGSGTTVTITGTSFSGATAVAFGGTPAASFTINPATTQITAIVGSGSTGLVTVTTPGGTAASATNFTFTTTPPPPPPPPNPLIGTGAPTSHGSSAAGTTTTTTTVTVPNIYTHTATLLAKTVAPGTPVTVTADIINRSTVNGSKKVTLYVNGQVESTQGITVNSGGASQLTFYVTRSEPGDYSVYVDGVPAGSFKVEMFRESDLILIFSVTMLAMAFMVGLIMLQRRRQGYY